MDKATIQLFNRVILPEVPSPTPNLRNKSLVVGLNAELAVYGYTLGPDLMRSLSGMSRDSILTIREKFHSVLADISGINSNHQTLFRKFPYEVPDQFEYLRNRIFGAMESIFPEFRPNRINLLSCGHVLNLDRFDPEDFGACPICQNQTNDFETDENDGKKYDYERTTPLRVLHVATKKWLKDTGNKLLARDSSLSQQERGFLLSIRNVGLKRPTAVYRENLPFIYEIFDGDIKGLVKSATDVMRIAYFLSDNASDLSMAENVRFKISTSHKKKLLRVLEGTQNLEEDMMRNRERWIRLGEILHVGSEKNSLRYPKVAEAFDKLRNRQKKILTFNRTVESRMRAKVVDSNLLEILSGRPGEFTRRLDFLLRTAKQPGRVLSAYSDVIKEVGTRLLFDLKKYFLSRPDMIKRVFVVKGAGNKTKIVDDTRAPIKEHVLLAAVELIEHELIRRFRKLPKMGSVYIEKGLENMLIPFNRRGDSGADFSMVKGSHYPMGDDPVIRAFVHWTGHVDVDLSLIGYDTNFNENAQVAYTNLSSGGIVHSGDITNAPNGASEFIDVDIKHMQERRIRYLMITLNSFRGQMFNTFPCYAGFMGRDSLRSGKKYEPMSVRMKYELTAKSTGHYPFLFDLVNRTVIFADVSSGMARYRRVLGNTDANRTRMQELISFPYRKTTVYDVLSLHARARGKIITDPKKADIAFLSDTNVDDISRAYL